MIRQHRPVAAGAVLLLAALTISFMPTPAPMPAAIAAASRGIAGPAAIVGSGAGLSLVYGDGRTESLLSGGEVRKLLRSGERWFVLGERGVLSSADLRNWDDRSAGLPVKTLKLYDGKAKVFQRVVQELKDLEADPADPLTLVTATKDAVYLTRDGGLTWRDLGNPTRTNGIKAVAVARMPELTVFVAHAIYGVSWIDPNAKKPVWTDLNAGLAKLETTENPDEVADIAICPAAAAGGPTEIFLGQTFKARLYRLDWPAKAFREIWSDRQEFGTVDSLARSGDALRFVWNGGIAELPLAGAGGPGEVRGRPDLAALAAAAGAAVGSPILCLLATDPATAAAPAATAAPPPPAATADGAALPALTDVAAYAAANGGAVPPLLTDVAAFAAANGGAVPPLLTDVAAFAAAATVALSELWLLDADRPAAAAKLAVAPGQAAAAAPPLRRSGPVGREGLYIPANHAADPQLLEPYLRTIENRGLDLAVVDMKDDYGRLRFQPRDPAVAARGRVFNPVDLDRFAAAMRARGVWLVARIVVFKDPELAKFSGGKFAVWDSRANAPWIGWYETKTKNPPAAAGAPPAEEYSIVRTNYDERWVDPYSEEVWEYVAALSRELIGRGFDEIQYDYIRFPTDGLNLADAQFRWRDSGMDKESAIMSFLNHVRSRVDAPISIDVYGANGWYRTGARTGQEVELLSRYVDVVCPMYYPSHFEQNFLADAPAELRPYRIYYRGSLRTDRIAHGRVTVRPYVQAFYLNVAYDRTYYGPAYVAAQVRGVRDAGAAGLTYWNNVGRYDDIPAPPSP